MSSKRSSPQTQFLYTIWYKILLPIDIESLLSESMLLKPSIELKKCNDLGEFERACEYYLENRKLQFNISGLLNNANFDTVKGNIIVRSFTDKRNIPEAIFSPNTYVYSQKDGIGLVPLMVNFKSIKFSRNTEIKIEGKTYFTEISPVENSNGEKYLELNSALKMILIDEKVQFNLSYNSNVLFVDYILAIEFLYTLQKYHYFTLEGNNIKFSSNISSDIKEFNLDYYDKLVTLFNYFRINYIKFKVNDVEENYNLIEILFDIFEKREVSIKDNNNEVAIFKKYNFLGNPIICLFLRSKENNNYFVGYNYFLDKFDSEIEITFKHNNTTLNCSRLIAIFLNNSSFLEIFDSILNYLPEIELDLINYYKSDFYSIYNGLMLEFLNYYDKVAVVSYLNIAKSINKLLEIDKNDKDYPSYIINEYQIIRREREFTDQEIKFLLKIKSDNSFNDIVKCCICILIETKHEFKTIFDSLSDSEKEVFKKWPIWNLYCK